MVKRRSKSTVHPITRIVHLPSLLQKLAAGQECMVQLRTAASPFQATVASLSANYVHGKHTSTHTHILLLHLKHKKNK